MRVLKILAVAGLVLALAAPTWALSFTGPIKIDVAGYANGTTYSSPPFPAPPSTVSGAAALDALGTQHGAPANASEDTFGIFKFNTVRGASIINPPPPGIIDGGVGPLLWLDGQNGQEIVAVIWGEVDTHVTLQTNGEQLDQGVGLKYAVWLQPAGAADAATSAFLGSAHLFGDAGSSGRLTPGVTPARYVGAGFTAAGTPIPGAVLWLSGSGAPGFLSVADPAVEYTSVFDATGIDLTTQANAYLSTGTNDAGTGQENDSFNQNFFQNTVGGDADLNFQVITHVVGPKAGSPAFDWQISFNGPATTNPNPIPEPVTMVGLLMSVLGVGGYLRRRLA